VPPGTFAIVRSEHASRNGGDASVVTVALEPGRRLEAEADIRRRGEELAGGETLLAPGSLITPPLAGLLAAAGIAQVEVAGELRVATLAIGDELVDGDAGDDAYALGLVRDSLTPQLGPILGMLGASPVSAQRIPDRPEAVADAVRSADADLVVTTGGTARGPADPLRAALAGLGAHPVLDGLALRPGGSVLLSHLPSGRRVLSLPGNPFAAVVDLLLLGSAFIDGALGRPLADLRACGLPEGLQRLAVARAVACVETEGALRPVAHQRSGMLRGLAEATHLVLVPASSEPETASARALPLPWS
jgi:molybdopterin molybdotransferase